MKKIFISIGITFVFLTVVFSGCIEEDSSSETSEDDKVELVNYDITTEWNEVIIDSLGLETSGSKVVQSGFYHNIPEKHFNSKYIIKGKVKNIAGEQINRIKINANFYDDSNNFLRAEYVYVFEIANSYSETFEMVYTESEEYFKNVYSVKFNFDVRL